MLKKTGNTPAAITNKAGFDKPLNYPNRLTASKITGLNNKVNLQ